VSVHGRQLYGRGEGVGARRTLTSTDGSTVVERLESVDEAARQLSYALLTDTPLALRDDHVLRDLVRARPNGVVGNLPARRLPASEAAALLEGALAANCRALKQLLER